MHPTTAVSELSIFSVNQTLFSQQPEAKGNCIKALPRPAHL